MKDLISSLLDITESEFQAFQEIGKYKQYSRQDFLIRAGDAVNKLYFLESGAVRAFRLVDGVDYTHYFFTDKWFVTDYKSFLEAQPANLFLEAITDLSCYEFRKEELIKLNEDFPKFEKLWKIVAEKAFLFTVNRLEDMQTKNLQQRYFELMERDPALFQSFPQKYIASYLGVTEQSLSRIKQR